MLLPQASRRRISLFSDASSHLLTNGNKSPHYYTNPHITTQIPTLLHKSPNYYTNPHITTQIPTLLHKSPHYYANPHITTQIPTLLHIITQVTKVVFIHCLQCQRKILQRLPKTKMNRLKQYLYRCETTLTPSTLMLELHFIHS